MAACFKLDPRCALLLSLFIVTLYALLIDGVFAADVANARTEKSDDDSAAAVTYRVVIDAPSSLESTLERDLSLVRWQSYDEMTSDLLERIANESIDEAKSAAAAEGFFSADIDVHIDRTTTPATVTLKVVPNEPTRISDVVIEVSGPATSDVPLGTDAIAKLKRDWLLPKGDVFKQASWSAAKQHAVATLAASPYASAKIGNSEASIDPQERRAQLFVELESGPPYRFGELDITGLVKYQPSLVRNFSTIKPGAPYSESELATFLRRLNGSGYFASVQGAIETDPEQAANAPVKIAVIEGPTKRLEGGVGYSTDVRYRANASYRDVDIDRKALQFVAEARLESKEQTATVRFTQPPNDKGWIGTYSGGATRTDIASLITRTAFGGMRWQSIDERNERAFSLFYYLDHQEPEGAPSQTSHAFYPEYEWYWRRVDDLVSPNAGWIATVHAGAGIPGVSTRGFGRAIARYEAWLPLDRSTVMQLRAETGAVIAPTRDGIPSNLLFRTGGDTTVRGYAFESLGVKQGDAIVPGRYYALGSVEAIRWMTELWGLAAFVDAGNAMDSLSDIHLALGYGIGARVRTPLGPFRLDLAYGRDEHSVRVHFSIGISF